jgi:hypothetical protein
VPAAAAGIIALSSIVDMLVTLLSLSDAFQVSFIHFSVSFPSSVTRLTLQFFNMTGVEDKQAEMRERAKKRRHQ